MKKRLLFFFVLSIIGLSTKVQAYDFSAVCSSGQTLYYNITSTTAPYKVYITYQQYGITKSTYGDLVIPDTVSFNGITYMVDSIGDRAFTDSHGLTSVIIPSSVTSIGNDAFSNCNNLCSVTIPASVTSIRRSAFSFCYSLPSITIPASVTSIGDFVFSDCGSLTSIYVDLNNTKYSSADGVLFNKNADTLIKYPEGKKGVYIIPNCVTLIYDYAFYGSEFLSSVFIPNSVTSIGKSVFSFCSRLTSIDIPNSVTSVGNGAFSYCKGITSITFPASVTSIGRYVFNNSTNLSSINIESNNPKYSSVDGVLFTKNADTLITCAEGRQGIYNVPNSVKNIMINAFTMCKLLTSVTIPSSVTSIGESAFSYCEALTSIIIPSTVVSIGSGAFYSTPYDNNKPNGIVYINNVLYRYKGIMPANTVIKIPSGIVSITGFAFNGCKGLVSITIPNSVVEIGRSAFNSCEGLASITIPSSVTSIESRTFSYCNGLTAITIPASVISIGEYAFNGCIKLASIKIPESVTFIGDYAFMFCYGLTSIAIPSSINTINTGVFSYCRDLSLVKIPASVISIGDYAFSNCTALDSIICEAINPPSIENYTFDDVDRTIPIYIPCGSLSLYQGAQYWSDFTNYKCLVGLDNEIETKVSTKIYPNPASDKAVLEFEGLNDNANVSVVDLLGRVIKEYKINKQDSNIEIDVRGFAKGVYNVVLRNDKMNITKKLIVR